MGLKVSVENGKLAIKIGAKVAKAGEKIKENVASVLAKLGITPLKVGFEPLAAYDATENKVYRGIRIDKKVAYEELKTAISKAVGFAVAMKYVTKETLSFFLGQAAAEESALANRVSSSTNTKEGN